MGYFEAGFVGPHHTEFLKTGPQDTPTHWKQTVLYLQDPIPVHIGGCGLLVCILYSLVLLQEILWKGVWLWPGTSKTNEASTSLSPSLFLHIHRHNLTLNIRHTPKNTYWGSSRQDSLIFSCDTDSMYRHKVIVCFSNDQLQMSSQHCILQLLLWKCVKYISRMHAIVCILHLLWIALTEVVLPETWDLWKKEPEHQLLSVCLNTWFNKLCELLWPVLGGVLDGHLPYCR